MTAAASWPKTLLVPAAAARQWQTLREVLLVQVTPCATAPDVWHSRNPSDIKAACDACHTCPAIAPCGQYAEAAGESSAVWGGHDRTKAPHVRNLHERTHPE